MNAEIRLKESKIPRPDGRLEIDWDQALLQLDERGFVLLPGVLARETCEAIAASYTDDGQFRSRIEMSRYAFGRGEYKYFKYPLPAIVQRLRSTIYPHMAPLANQWLDRLGSQQSRFPDTLSEFTDQCHRAGQERPTPLLLKYGAGDFNCLHRDLYGEIFFPFQVTIFLSRPSKDFEGGEFVLAEPGRRCDLRGRPSAGSRRAGLLPRASAPRRQHRSLRQPVCFRNYFSRCELRQFQRLRTRKTTPKEWLPFICLLTSMIRIASFSTNTSAARGGSPTPPADALNSG
jgi:uncharacterized protein